MRKEPNVAGTSNVSTFVGQWADRSATVTFVRTLVTLKHSYKNDVHLNKDTIKLSLCTLRKHGRAEAKLRTFSTPVLDAVGCLIHAPAALPQAAIEQEAGWSPGSVWKGMESLAHAGIRSRERTARIVVAIQTMLTPPTPRAGLDANG